MGPDVAKKRGDESKNYSPPIPPTRIPFLLTPDHFYVRFLDFSVFHFPLSFFEFFGPREPGLESPANYRKEKQMGVISGNINPPGGRTGTNPGLLDPRMHQKVKV